jgi:serine/threonine protein kinase
VPPAARHLMRGLLARDPRKRTSVEDALHHPFFSGKPLSLSQKRALAKAERTATLRTASAVSLLSAPDAVPLFPPVRSLSGTGPGLPGRVSFDETVEASSRDEQMFDTRSVSSISPRPLAPAKPAAQSQRLTRTVTRWISAFIGRIFAFFTSPCHGCSGFQRIPSANSAPLSPSRSRALSTAPLVSSPPFRLAE